MTKPRLSETHPQIAAQWHPTKNEDLSPSDVTPASKEKVWWVSDCGHEWQSLVASRTRGSGCPICTPGTSVVLAGTNDLATLNPDLAKQWHPTKNGALNPESVKPGSPRKVWWLAGCGHEWSTTIASRHKGGGCPYCKTTGRKWLLAGFNDLLTCNPDLASQWHPSKNGEVGPQDVTAKSHTRIWWQCSRDLRHEWEATVKDRAFGYGCPFCANQKVLAGYNDLKTQSPEISEQWHPEKNGTLTPGQVSPFSKKRIWWQCSLDKHHEWIATCGDRSAGYGCPYCSGNTVLAGYNDLATTHPRVAAEWHPTKNGKKQVTEVSKGGMTKYWWLCPVGHSYTQLPNSRTHGRGCPYCANRTLLEGFNDLATAFPDVAAQWHPGKNKKQPNEILGGSHSKAWWLCDEDHEWRAQIKSRTMGRGCPHCRKPWSVAEKEVFGYVVETFGEMVIHENYRAPHLGNFEIDIYVEDVQLAIEFNGEYWHDESRDPAIKDRHDRKQEICDSRGVRMAVVWENDWSERQREVEEQIVRIVTGDNIPVWMTYARK